VSPADAQALASVPWWVWPVALFGVCFLLGIVAVPAGIGGAVLFVPIVSGFFPFHLDYVRGAGLLVALAGALSAGPRLLESGLASLRLGLPLALVASVSAIGGAMLGLALPTQAVQVALGVTVLGIVVVMALSRQDDAPDNTRPDALGDAMRLAGVYRDAHAGAERSWRACRTPLGLTLFAGIGVLAGLFGLGAGWANLPTLNLVMGVPIKVSAGTSSFILSLVDSAAAWVYLHQGAVLAIVAVPAMAGMSLGARIGLRLLDLLPPRGVRRLVLAMLTLAGLRALLKGLGWWT
jgi:uncharacterized protein